ncbi:hypothetical protein ACFY8K_14890 [Streptomyces misionensis]|uniref:hypothetical protein n=1 Tax=Streptomyces misionensis TaxID=67331 RepID=UPI00369E54DA
MSAVRRPGHPGSTGEGRVHRGHDAAFVDEDTLIAGTCACDARHGGRHWLVDARAMTPRGEISYPVPVSGPARPAGDGAWYTVSGDGALVPLWEPDRENRPRPASSAAARRPAGPAAGYSLAFATAPH